MSTDETSAARAAAVDSLDEVARALKRQAQETKVCLQTVRRAQARLVGIAVGAPTSEIHSARAELAGTSTRPQGGRSDPSEEEHRAA